MGAIHIDAPPRLADAQIYQYLFRIVQDLNLALTSIDEGNMTPAAAERLTSGGRAAQEAKQEATEAAATLKGLIIKTATTVHNEMTALEIKLNGLYGAEGPFGTFVSQTKQTINALPQYIEQQIETSDTITGIEKDIEGLQTYNVESEGYIKSGIVRYDGAVPKLGIAIGQKIQTTGTKVDVDGVLYDVIEGGQTLAEYTSEGLTFYINGTAVAHMSNRELQILDAKIQGTMTHGPWLWEQDAVRGLTLRYVGAATNV